MFGMPKRVMFGMPKRVVIFDLECTTWEGAAARGWSGPGEHRELVQIGAAIVETKKFKEIAHFSLLVRPRVNPTLSDYFINLTGIIQERLDAEGLSFQTFLDLFSDWCGDYELYCFDSRVDGSRLFDRDVLIENCDLCGLEFPFDPERFHNINEIFFKNGYVVKQSGAASKAFGVEPKVRSHDAMNDVRGLIDGLKLLKKRGPKK